MQITKAMVFGAIGAVSMIFVALGSVLPWATVSALIFSASKGGLSGDGVFTIILAFLGLGSFVFAIAKNVKRPFVAGFILSLLISGIAVYDAFNFASMGAGTKAGVDVSVGIGLILCIIGGVSTSYLE